MASKRQDSHPNPDLRHRVPGPLPPVAAVEAALQALLAPSVGTARPAQPRADDPHAGPAADTAGDGGVGGEFGVAAGRGHCGGGAPGGQ